MDIMVLRRKIDALIHSHSSSLIPEIKNTHFSCTRCGWCCRMHFDIKITENILRPSNAISIFPCDIRRIMKMTGYTWDKVVEPDIYSCFSDSDDVLLIGWILRRNDDENCVFFDNCNCTIYTYRPLICRCYPFFIADDGIEIMNCDGLGKKRTNDNSMELGLMLKRYEIRKLQSYIKIIDQIGDKLDNACIKSLPANYSGDVIVFDGETISKLNIKNRDVCRS